jgi:cytochrome b6-f complex subunit 5
VIYLVSFYSRIKYYVYCFELFWIFVESRDGYNWYLFDTLENSPDFIMVEPLLAGIVLAIVPVTIVGLFITAYLQFRRGDQLGILMCGIMRL